MATLTRPTPSFPSEALRARYFGASLLADAEKVGRTIDAHNSVRWVHWLLLRAVGFALFVWYIQTLRVGVAKFVAPVTGWHVPTLVQMACILIVFKLALIGLPTRTQMDKINAIRAERNKKLWLDKYKSDWEIHFFAFAILVIFNTAFWWL